MPKRSSSKKGLGAKRKRTRASSQPRLRERSGRLRQGGTIPAGEFKAVCLELMDRVKRTGEEFVITKRNRPVAKLAPITHEGLLPFVGRSGGVLSATRDDLLAPIGEDWEVDADL